MVMGRFITVHTPIHSRLLNKENGGLKRGKTGRRLVRVSKIVTDAQQVSSRGVNCRYSGDIVFLDRDSGTSLMAYCRLSDPVIVHTCRQMGTQEGNSYS